MGAIQFMLEQCQDYQDYLMSVAQNGRAKNVERLRKDLDKAWKRYHLTERIAGRNPNKEYK